MLRSRGCVDETGIFNACKDVTALSIPRVSIICGRPERPRGRDPPRGSLQAKRRPARGDGHRVALRSLAVHELRYDRFLVEQVIRRREPYSITRLRSRDAARPRSPTFAEEVAIKEEIRLFADERRRKSSFGEPVGVEWRFRYDVLVGEDRSDRPPKFSSRACARLHIGGPEPGGRNRAERSKASGSSASSTSSRMSVVSCRSRTTSRS